LNCNLEGGLSPNPSIRQREKIQDEAKKLREEVGEIARASEKLFQSKTNFIRSRCRLTAGRMNDRLIQPKKNRSEQNRWSGGKKAAWL